MVLENRPAPTPTGRADEPDMGTGLIDTERYTSPEFARLEWERMWTKVWLNAGPLSDIPEVGDHFVHAVGRESFIFMRTAPDEVKGFYNICPHRGSRLRPSMGLGHAEQLQCPFHLWTFDLSGALMDVPDRQHFVNGIPDDKQRLSEVRVETWRAGCGSPWTRTRSRCASSSASSPPTSTPMSWNATTWWTTTCWSGSATGSSRWTSSPRSTTCPPSIPSCWSTSTTWPRRWTCTTGAGTAAS